MSERETIEFTTPAGHKVVFNSYLTGREAQDLKAVMFASLKVNMDDAASGRVGIGEVPSTFLVEQEKKALTFLVVSFDAITDDPVGYMLNNFPSSEYEAVLKEINQIQNPTTPERSAPTGGATSQAA